MISKEDKDFKENKDLLKTLTTCCDQNKDSRDKDFKENKVAMDWLL